MRSRRHIPDSHSTHPNVIPLVDVMLCMIVFYMLVAKFGVNNGADRSIQLAVTTIGTEMQKVGVDTLVLNVRETLGEPDVTGLIESSQGVTSIPLQNLPARKGLRDTLLFLRLGPDGKEGSADDRPNFAVVIRGDGEMSYKSFMPVMLAVTDAGVKNIWHNTAKPEAGAKR